MAEVDLGSIEGTGIPELSESGKYIVPARFDALSRAKAAANGIRVLSALVFAMAVSSCGNTQPRVDGWKQIDPRGFTCQDVGGHYELVVSQILSQLNEADPNLNLDNPFILVHVQGIVNGQTRIADVYLDGDEIPTLNQPGTVDATCQPNHVLKGHVFGTGDTNKKQLRTPLDLLLNGCGPTGDQLEIIGVVRFVTPFDPNNPSAQHEALVSVSDAPDAAAIRLNLLGPQEDLPSGDTYLVLGRCPQEGQPIVINDAQILQDVTVSGTGQTLGNFPGAMVFRNRVGHNRS